MRGFRTKMTHFCGMHQESVENYPKFIPKIAILFEILQKMVFLFENCTKIAILFEICTKIATRIVSLFENYTKQCKFVHNLYKRIL